MKSCAVSINDSAARIISDTQLTSHARYLKLYQHMRDSDDIVAECFNDWRRSRMGRILLSLRRHTLLTDEHLQNLTESARDCIRNTENF